MRSVDEQGGAGRRSEAPASPDACDAWQEGEAFDPSPVVRWVVTETADALRLRRMVRYQGTTASGGRSGGGERKAITEMTARSRGNMRWTFAALPWDQLGRRPAMVTFTYPGEWRRYVGSGEQLERHRHALHMAWNRRYGRMVGVWIKEFQESGRPHLHMYLAVPDEVSEDDFEGLRQRTLKGQRLEARYGRYRGRAELDPIGGPYGGEFARWLLVTWARIVGSDGERDASLANVAHQYRGVDVRVCFWKETVEKDRMEVARYFFKESGKLGQKQAPEGFGPVGRYWGVFGQQNGFKPQEWDSEVGADVAAELERRMVRIVRWRAIRSGFGKAAFDRRRWGDGVTVYELSEKQQARLYEYAQSAALARPGWARARRREAASKKFRRQRVDVSYCYGCPETVRCDRACSVEELRSPVQHLGFHWL